MEKTTHPEGVKAFRASKKTLEAETTFTSMLRRQHSATKRTTFMLATGDYGNLLLETDRKQTNWMSIELCRLYQLRPTAASSQFCFSTGIL